MSLSWRSLVCLAGIMKKYRQGRGSRQQRQGGGGGGGGNSGSSDVAMWLEQLQGRFSLSDVDERCRDTFNQLPGTAKVQPNSDRR